jgi:signal transduction histidine kinase
MLLNSIVSSTNATASMVAAQESQLLSFLIIEDNYGDVRILELFLADGDFQNYETINKTTLADGIAAMYERDYSVVLLDLTLPDSRGFDTLRTFFAAHPDANVIAMTGLSDKAIGMNAVRMGAQDFLSKGGFDAALLLRTLRYAIDRKNAQRNIAESQRLREVAEESSRLREQFIASISHEMRTPMNAIYGMSNLLAETPLNDEQKGYIHNIKQSSEILLGVINDILEVSTLRNGKMNFEEKDFDIKELLINLVNVMQYKKNEKLLDFLLNIDPSVPQFIKGDKLRLNQILFNIVGNAVKFTDEGFVKLDIRILEENNDQLVLKFVIKDSGIGIPTDKIDTIFETFTRVRTKDRIYEGTGLGLAIVKNLVDQQNGKVWAESKLGEGTTMHIEMPFKKVSVSNALSSRQNVQVEVERLKYESFSLLLVEDHIMNQIVARKTLENKFNNISIKVANNGQDAINILRGGDTFDIILMDIQMPVMDGNETVAYIREKMPEIKTPVIAMTAHAYIAKDGIYKTYGFDDCVLKPFEPDQLFSKINQYAFSSLNS